jgi:hypothetical protein
MENAVFITTNFVTNVETRDSTCALADSTDPKNLGKCLKHYDCGGTGNETKSCKAGNLLYSCFVIMRGGRSPISPPTAAFIALSQVSSSNSKTTGC